MPGKVVSVPAGKAVSRGLISLKAAVGNYRLSGAARGKAETWQKGGRWSVLSSCLQPPHISEVSRIGDRVMSSLNRNEVGN